MTDDFERMVTAFGEHTAAGVAAQYATLAAEIERRDDAIRYVARFLLDARDNAERVAIDLNAHAKRTGRDFDRRADSAEGAQGAYSAAIAALAGSLGMSIDDLAADTVSVNRPIERATLPSELTDIDLSEPQGPDWPDIEP